MAAEPLIDSWTALVGAATFFIALAAVAEAWAAYQIHKVNKQLSDTTRAYAETTRAILEATEESTAVLKEELINRIEPHLYISCDSINSVTGREGAYTARVNITTLDRMPARFLNLRVEVISSDKSSKFLECPEVKEKRLTADNPVRITIRFTAQPGIQLLPTLRYTDDLGIRIYEYNERLGDDGVRHRDDRIVETRRIRSLPH